MRSPFKGSLREAVKSSTGLSMLVESFLSNPDITFSIRAASSALFVIGPA